MTAKSWLQPAILISRKPEISTSCSSRSSLSPPEKMSLLQKDLKRNLQDCIRLSNRREPLGINTGDDDDDEEEEEDTCSQCTTGTSEALA